MIYPHQEKLFQYIDEHISHYLDERKLLSSQYPHMHTMRQVVTSQLQSQGLQTQSLGGGTQLLYSELTSGACNTLLLYSSYGLPLFNQQEMEPGSQLKRQLHNDNLSPRSRSNPRSSIAANLAALDAYQQVAGLLPVNIKWLLDGENEIGNPTIIEENRQLLHADGCLWEGENETRDGTPLLALGTRGFLRVALEVQTAPSALHSMHGAVVPNALWRLVWALNSLKDAREEILIEGFYDMLLPAEDNEIELLYTLPDTAPFLAKQWGMEHLLLGLQGFQLHYTHLLTPTCTINSISAGNEAADSRNIIPFQARALLDFYLVPDQDPLDIFAKLQQHFKVNGFDDIQARMLCGSKPARTPLAAPFVQIVRRATTAAYGREPYILPLTTSSAPIYPLRQILNLPVMIAGMGYVGANASAPDEFVNEQNFAASIKQRIMIFEEMASLSIPILAQD